MCSLIALAQEEELGKTHLFGVLFMGFYFILGFSWVLFVLETANDDKRCGIPGLSTSIPWPVLETTLAGWPPVPKALTG